MLRANRPAVMSQPDKARLVIVVAALCDNHRIAARHARQPAVRWAVAPGESSDFTALRRMALTGGSAFYLNVPGAAPLRRGALSAYEVENELRQRLHGRVVVQTHDRDVVFVYTRTQDAAAAAQQAVSDLLAERSIPAQVVVERWHLIAEQWELPEAPLPADEAAERAERTLLDAAETRESLAFGAAMYDLRKAALAPRGGRASCEPCGRGIFGGAAPALSHCRGEQRRSGCGIRGSDPPAGTRRR